MADLKHNVKRAVQFIESTPEEISEPVIIAIQTGFEEIQKHLQPKQPTEFLTRNEVKELLKVDLSTIHNWTKRGKLKAYGLGTRIYYKRSEIELAIKPLN